MVVKFRVRSLLSLPSFLKSAIVSSSKS
jgi:hypothetical protein